MFRLLLIAPGPDAATGDTWALPGFDVQVCTGPLDEAALTNDPPDALVVLAGPSVLEGAAELFARLEAALDPEPIPLVIALDPSRHALPSALEVDGVLDTRWPASVIGDALAMTIGRVRSGRGVAAIQQQVLGAVRREMLLLRDLSIRDGLTGLYNFRFFREVLAREHRRCERYARPYAVVCFDLDHLRELNNRYGHEVGTRALGRVGLTLSTTARSTDFTFRIGGDEFASLLLECNRELAGQYAERVRAAVRQCVVQEGEVRIPVSVSAGIAAYPEDGDSFEAVLRSADALLYRAKGLGRDRVVLAPPGSIRGEVA